MPNYVSITIQSGSKAIYYIISVFSCHLRIFSDILLKTHMRNPLLSEKAIFYSNCKNIGLYLSQSIFSIFILQVFQNPLVKSEILILKMKANNFHVQEQDSSFQAYEESQSSSACYYSKISLKDRIRLIEMVYLEKCQIIRAASSLDIRPSTAKHILRNFRRHGKILKKNDDKYVENQQYQSKIEKLKLKVDEIQRIKFQKRKMKEKHQIHKNQKINLQKNSKDLRSIPNPISNAQENTKMLIISEHNGIQHSEVKQAKQQYFYFLCEPVWYNYFGLSNIVL